MIYTNLKLEEEKINEVNVIENGNELDKLYKNYASLINKSDTLFNKLNESNKDLETENEELVILEDLNSKLVIENEALKCVYTEIFESKEFIKDDGSRFIATVGKLVVNQ